MKKGKQKEKINYAKRIFDFFFTPLYNRFQWRLARDLKIRETEELLLSINHHIFTLQKKLEDHDKTLLSNLLLASGLNLSEHELQEEFNLSGNLINDLLNVISPVKHDESSIVAFYDHISNVNLKDRVVCIIGGKDNLYSHLSIRKGAAKVIRVESSPKLARETIKNSTVIYSYPLNLTSIELPLVDIMLIPDSSFAALLAFHQLFKLGGRVRKALIITARVAAHTAFTDKIEPEIFTVGNRLVFNDNYLRSLLHRSGFVELKCAYTSGNNIDNRFDEKVTKFNQLKGFTVVKKNTKYAKDKKYNPSSKDVKIVQKTYVATKLPSKKYI